MSTLFGVAVNYKQFYEAKTNLIKLQAFKQPLVNFYNGFICCNNQSWDDLDEGFEDIKHHEEDFKKVKELNKKLESIKDHEVEFEIAEAVYLLASLLEKQEEMDKDSFNTFVNLK